ncbi:unnamed protein product [Lactuca saligna]|uniref:Signal peptide peptidase n=1 Tax=Lactuca saligna TaxID=75948 RepID=A0AA35UKF0_LACSI|nr:unnamed protein product [Lactuca saligna]
MEPLWKLIFLMEPAPVTLILTAIAVTFGSALRALNYGKEMEKNRDLSEASITLDRSQALMIPVMSSCSLLMMFYLFSSVSQLLTAFTAIASISSLYFCFSPYISHVKSQFNLSDPFISRCCSKPLTRIQSLLLFLCITTVAAWLVSGHWVLNNMLGISLCVAFVSHNGFLVQMLCLPGLQLITKKLELPVKIVFPRNLLGGVVPGNTATDFMMLGLGDMAIPSMLLALVLCFDHRKENISLSPHKGYKYIWYATIGYAVGLVTALAAGILTHSPQPALLYLVPSTLGPVVVISWTRKELKELWEGSSPNLTEKTHSTEV